MPDKYKIDKLPSGGTQYMRKNSPSHQASKQFASGGANRGSPSSIRTFIGDKFEGFNELGSKSGVHRTGPSKRKKNKK